MRRIWARACGHTCRCSVDLHASRLLPNRGWLEFLVEDGGMSDLQARDFLSRRYMMLCVNATVPKKVTQWLAAHAPGKRYDGEHAKPEDCCAAGSVVFALITTISCVAMN